MDSIVSLLGRRFTDSAQLIVQQLVDRAGDRGLFHVDDASVVPLALWTLIRWERKVGLVALETMGVDLHSLADKLDALLTRLADEHPVVFKDGVAVYAKTGARIGSDLSTAIETLLTQSESEACKLEHNYVGSEHLLLAIITRANSQLSAILQDHLVTYDCTKDTILEVLGSYMPQPGDSVAPRLARELKLKAGGKGEIWVDLAARSTAGKMRRLGFAALPKGNPIAHLSFYNQSAELLATREVELSQRC